MKTIQIVTSFSETGYNTYAKKCIETFIQFWPSDVILTAYYHSDLDKPRFELPEDAPKADNVVYYPLDDVDELIPFKEHTRKFIQTKTGKPYPENMGWKIDVVKWCNKVFALGNANAQAKGVDWLIWLDADTFTTKPISRARLEGWLNDKADVVHLGRTSHYYSETSFVGFNLARGPAAGLFIEDILGQYLSGEFQYYTEWHDGFIFERLLNISIKHGLVPYNLSFNVRGLKAFEKSELGYFMTHLKGFNKNPEVDAPPVIPDRVSDFKVNPQDCVAQEEIKNNIIENCGLIKNWIHRCKLQAKERKAIFVSGGPSLSKYIEDVRKLKESGGVIFSVKHSYKTLMDNGIVPDFCVIIDPREIDGTSTHGYKRKDLLSAISPDTCFLMSSMSHPSVTKYLLENGANILGWHADSGELRAVINRIEHPEKYKNAVAIGTCSAMRGLGLAELMGFQSYTLVGYDSSLEKQPEDLNVTTTTGAPRYLCVAVNVDEGPQIHRIINTKTPVLNGEYRFWSTGELVALYQDFLSIVPFFYTRPGFSVEVLTSTDTLIGAGWQSFLNARTRQDAFAKVMKEELETAVDFATMVNEPDRCPVLVLKDAV